MVGCPGASWLGVSGLGGGGMSLSPAGVLLMGHSCQNAQPNSGLLQASVVTLYTMFVTWLALSNVPGEYRSGFEEAWPHSWVSNSSLGGWEPSQLTGTSQPQAVLRHSPSWRWGDPTCSWNCLCHSSAKCWLLLGLGWLVVSVCLSI